MITPAVLRCPKCGSCTPQTENAFRADSDNPWGKNVIYIAHGITGMKCYSCGTRWIINISFTEEP